MTSVQNHRLQLSGNSVTTILLFVLVTMLSSCGSSRKVTKRPSRGDETMTDSRKQRKKGEKVDTIVFIEIPETREEPIRDDDAPSLDKDDQYQMTVLLPFKAQGMPDTYNERFIEFYAGIQMAMDDLIEEGINVTLNTLDTEENVDLTANKLRSSTSTDLLIGPYDRKCLQEAANWAKDHEIPMVSPWIASSRITKENPYYIQLRPGVREHYVAMVDDILNHYTPEQVIILKQTDGKDDAKVRYIQEYAAAKLKVDGKSPFQEFEVEMDSLILGETYLSELFNMEKETVFISHNYLFDEDEFVYNCLRKLSAAKGEREAIVYGMPLLIDLEKIDFNLYKLLNVKVVRSRYVDPYNKKVKNFRGRFYYRFESLPSEEAYYGYDVGYYFGHMLEKYGKTFQFFIDQEEDVDLLEVNFDIQRSFVNDTFSDDYRDIDYFTNKHLDIIEFDGDHFIVRKN